MKLLEGLSGAFDVEDIPHRIKDFLKEQRNKLGDEDFVPTMLYWFGGRGYNQYLDYSLFAIKVAKLFNSKSFSAFHKISFHEEVYVGIVGEFLFDDRHDIYQNVPYSLKTILDNSTSEEKELILERFATFCIECFNCSGKIDPSVNFVIKEE